MKIQVLVDNLNSWIVPYAREITEAISKLGHQADFINTHEAVTAGDILVLLSCTKIFKNLHLNRHNLVVHESALPLGKGWSPMTWQVIEGQKQIPVTLFEATPEVDSGVIYGQTEFSVEPTDLVSDLRNKQADCTKNLLLNFIKSYPDTPGRPQVGPSTYYRRRTAEDHQISWDSNIKENWGYFQTADNTHYPVHIVIDGQKFILKIEKA